jgi:hypothetical protein
LADLEDVRQIALALPETTADEDGVGVRSGGKVKGIAWRWKERVDPNKARVPNPSVLAVRTPSLADKESLLATDPEVYFTEPHYNNYPAVLVRLANIDPDELKEILEDAWRSQASKESVKQFDTARIKGVP